VSDPIDQLLSIHGQILLIQTHVRVELWPIYSELSYQFNIRDCNCS